MKSIFRKAIAAGGLASLLAFSTSKSEVLSNLAVSDDFNNDGKKDLLVLVYQWQDYNQECPGNGEQNYMGLISISDNNGKMSRSLFVPNLNFYSEPEELAVRDVNGDGNKDLIFKFYDPDDCENFLFRLNEHTYLGNGDGDFKFNGLRPCPDYR